MTDTPAEVVESIDPPRRSRHWRRLAVVLAIMLLLFGVPWWTLLASGAAWPTVVFVVGTLIFVAAWVLFVWSVLGQFLRLTLLVAGVEDPTQSRVVAGAVLVVVAALLVWGYAEAMRVPRVRKL